MKQKSLFALALLALTALNALAQAPKQVEVFGQKINYIETGAGPNVILLHGLADDLSVWEQTIPALASKYRVWALDQIGCGRSDKPPLNYRAAVFVEFLNGFYKKVGIEKATLVGNSLGGWVAAAFAHAYPDKVEKLVLVGASGYWPKQLGVQELTREQLMLLSVSSPQKKLAVGSWQLAVGSAAANCQLPTANFFISFRASPCDLAAPSAYKETMKWMLHDDSIVTDAFVEEAYTAQLKRRDGFTIERFIESVLRGEDRLDNKVKQIKAPTLIIWGRQDEVTPLNIGAAFAKEIPNAQTAFIDRCGHMPQWECPTPLNRALLDFLAGGSTAAAK